MKDSKEYAVKLDKIIRSLKNLLPKVKPQEFVEPLEALLFGLLCEHWPEKTARKIFKNLQSHFTDFNDLRVSRAEEILDIFQDNSPQASQVASAMTGVLNRVFDRYDTLALTVLKDTGKRQARKDLQDLNAATAFAVNFCFLTAIGGHVIPLNSQMLDFLKTNQLIDPDASIEEIETFLERHVSASQAWEFYQLLRYGSENPEKILSDQKKAAGKTSSSRLKPKK